ncbi:DUF2799 domain-containing protein [Vibrio taketomensis]|uniref:DUF2799 domain-containing protein n=1 Tax=Vibrio taketomensis TaxID=2572923 RepID=UPI001389931B|nr:DUF2799 domain-containing protein [Vibrio taketomensis]
MKKLFSVMILSALAGCSSSIEDFAQAGDWYQVGYQDGIRGVTARSINELSSMGNVNTADYDQGYLQGVTEYCDPNAAYQIGLSGQLYEGVCEGTEDAQRFRMEWQRGWDDSRLSY